MSHADRMVDLLLQISEGTPCTQGSGLDWTRRERRFRLAETRSEAREVATEFRSLCAECPAVQACLQWARADHYSGWAAGQYMVNGKKVDETRRVGSHARIDEAS